MIYNALKILEKCDYLITYNYLGQDSAELKISWTGEKYLFKWDNESEVLISNVFDRPIPVKRYAANHLVYFAVKRICESYGYNQGFIRFQREGVITNSMFIVHPSNMTEIEYQQNKDIHEICNDITTGLMPEHIAAAKEFSIWDGFKTIIEQCYGVNINES